MLCGLPPFRAIKDKDIKKKILKGDFNFNRKRRHNINKINLLNKTIYLILILYI